MDYPGFLLGLVRFVPEYVQKSRKSWISVLKTWILMDMDISQGWPLAKGPPRNYVTVKRGGGGKNFALREVRKALESAQKSRFWRYGRGRRQQNRDFGVT